MKATEAGFVVFRVVGMFVLIWGVLGLISSLSFFAYEQQVEGANLAWLGGAQLLAYFIAMSLAAYAFVHARKVSCYLLDSADDLEVSASLLSLQAVAFSVVGALFALRALPHLGTNLAQSIWVLRAGAELELERFLSSETCFDVLYSVLSFVAGAVLFARSTRIARLWSEAQG